ALLSYGGVGPIPEAAEIARELHRPSVRREERDAQWFAARTDTRRVCQSEQFLQLDRSRDAAIVFVLEADVAPARNAEGLRRISIDRPAQVVRDGVGEADGVERRCAARRIGDDGTHVERASGERDPPEDPLVVVSR